MDSQSIPSEGISTADCAAQVFQVHFSDPSVWARLGVQPQQHWRLAGKGVVSIEDHRIVLRGRRSRLFWVAAKTEVQIPRADILNVVRDGSVVQCQVRISGHFVTLRLWSGDERAAEQLVQSLPQQRTADFEERLAQHSSFNSALSGLGTRPLITPALVVVNCAIFAATVYAGAGLIEPNGSVLVQWGTNFGPRTLDGEWWRLFTSMFLHFGLLHVALNMWALWSMGQLTEKLFGSAYFLVLYIFAGLCGSLASLYAHPALNSAGASGAIFGVLAGLFAFMVNPKTRIPASIAAKHRNSAIVFIAYNLFNGFAHAGIDNAAHLGGLAGGFAMGWLLARPVNVEARQDPLPRLAIGTLLGAAIVVALSWPQFHPSPMVAAERTFRHQFQLFAEDESNAVDAQNALGQLQSSHQITPREWGRRITTEIIPKWQVAEDRISPVELPADSRLFPLRAAMVDYLDKKRLSLQLLSDAARYDDAEKLREGTQAFNQSEAKATEIQALIRKVY